MSASKEFICHIQDRLGGATFEQAEAACRWLNEKSPIDPAWGAGDVSRYLKDLGGELEPGCSFEDEQKREEKADAVWSQMWLEVFEVRV